MTSENKNIKYLIVQTIAIIIAGICLYPLFDLILCKFITYSEFIYSPQEHIVNPIIFGCIMGTVLYLVKRKSKN